MLVVLLCLLGGVGLLLGFALGGFERLLHPTVRFLHIGVVLLAGIVQNRPVANQKVHISHGVLIVGIDLKRLLLIVDSVRERLPVLRLEIGLQILFLLLRRFQRTRILR